MNYGTKQSNWNDVIPGDKMPAYDALSDPHLRGMQNGLRVKSHMKKLKELEERSRISRAKQEKLAQRRNIHCIYGCAHRHAPQRAAKPPKKQKQHLPTPHPAPSADHHTSTTPSSPSSSSTASTPSTDLDPYSDTFQSADKVVERVEDGREEEEEEEEEEVRKLSGEEEERMVDVLRGLIQPNYGAKGLGKPAVIAPYLLLSDGKAAKNVALLGTMSVSLVVNCAPSQCKTNAGTYEGTGIGYHEIAALDDPAYPLLERHMAEVATLVREQKEAGGVVLVHCFQGINRSATLVAGCLMAVEKRALRDAVVMIHSARPVVLQGNDGFVTQLLRMAAHHNLLGGLEGEGQD